MTSEILAVLIVTSKISLLSPQANVEVLVKNIFLCLFQNKKDLLTILLSKSKFPKNQFCFGMFSSHPSLYRFYILSLFIIIILRKYKNQSNETEQRY